MQDTRFDVSPEQMESVARKMLKASDNYAKMDVLEDVVDWGDRMPFVWHMIDAGVYPAWEDPAIWFELADHAGEVSGEQIAAFLARVKSYAPAVVEAGDDDDEPAADDDDDYSYGGGYEYGGYDYGYGGGGVEAYQPPMFVSFWPEYLDRLVFEAYADDPAPFEARMAEYSDDVRRGLELVSFRTGRTSEPPEGILGELASAQGSDNGLPWAIKSLGEDGKVVELELGNEENLRRFVEQFGTWEEWGRALLDVVMAAEYPPGFERLAGVWTVATADEVQHLIAEVSIYGNNAASVVERLLSRSESAEEFAALGRKLADEDHERGAEILATAALHRVAAAEAVPDGIEALIGFDMFGSPMHRDRYEAVEVFSKALWAIPAPRLEARIHELFAGEYTKAKPFCALRVARRRGLDVLTGAFEALRATKEDYQTFHGLRSHVVGMSWLPLRDVDRVLAEAEKPGTDAMKDAFHRAALGILADAESFDAKYDQHVTYVDWRDDSIDANDLSTYVFGDVHQIIEKLAESRATAILTRDARSDGTWARVFAGLSKRPIESVLDIAMARLATDGIGPERTFFEDLLRQHPDLVKPRLGAVLAAQADPDFHNSVKRGIGEQAYNEVLADSGVEGAADSGPADKVRRLSEAYFEANPDAPKARVTVFERSDRPAEPTEIGRIGGRPFGLDADSWPVKGGDEDAPMEHLVTIDVAHAPNLQGRENVRAIALFCHNPHHNEAYGPGNGYTRVMFLSEEDVANGPYDGAMPVGSDQPVAIVSHALEVPADCFSVEYGTDAKLEAIRGALYQANAWSGPMPIWLQNDEHWGDFIFQFDEGFVHMNLGDMGIMYTFSDTAFWQCH